MQSCFDGPNLPPSLYGPPTRADTASAGGAAAVNPKATTQDGDILVGSDGTFPKAQGFRKEDKKKEPGGREGGGVLCYMQLRFASLRSSEARMKLLVAETKAT